MAQTTAASIQNQIPQLWDVNLFAQAENRTFWGAFEGEEGSGAPIIRKDDLAKEAGDTIKMDLVLALAGAGVTGDTNALSGNEEALKFNQISLTVSDLAHAVKWTEKAKILNVHNLRPIALRQLQKWLAGKLDDAIWTALTAASQPTINKWFAGTATSIGTVDDTDAAGRLKLNDISDVKAYAQATLKIEPFQMEDGEEFFGLVVHPFTNLSLKKDTNYQQAQRDAGIRGDGNRLFTGAVFLWDGVIGYSSNRTPTAADGVGAIAVSRNVFFGAQALTRGFAQYPDWREEQFDYGRGIGIATTLIKGEKLNVFDLSQAQDTSGNTAIGSVLVYASAKAPVA